MRMMRFLPAVLLTATLASSQASAQFAPGPGRLPDFDPTAAPTGDSVPGGMPRRNGNALERVSMNAIPGTGADDPSSPSGPPLPAATPYSNGGVLPPGSYASPFLTDKNGCCGPLGGNGPVTYEITAFTGPNYVGGSDLADRLSMGWMVGASARTLYFNRESTAAWALDLGLSYTFNKGHEDDPLFALDKGSTTTDQFGQTTTTPPTIKQFALRNLNRTSFNYGIGRDWWFWGPGAAGYESSWNLRWGANFGGRWGTAHVDMVPADDPEGYFRRQKVYLGVYGDVHFDWEVPVGGWIWFSGLKLQYGYDWMNIIPPLDSNISNVNFLMQTGVRF